MGVGVSESVKTLSADVKANKNNKKRFAMYLTNFYKKYLQNLKVISKVINLFSEKKLTANKFLNLDKNFSKRSK